MLKNQKLLRRADGVERTTQLQAAERLLRRQKARPAVSLWCL